MYFTLSAMILMFKTWASHSGILTSDLSLSLMGNSRVSTQLNVTFKTFFCRITKPLTFADCVGDELPLGWETVYDQQIGVYYMDHINRK